MLGYPCKARERPYRFTGTVALRLDAVLAASTGATLVRYPTPTGVGCPPMCYDMTAAGVARSMTSSRRSLKQAAVLVPFLARRPGQATVVSQTTPTPR